MIRIVNDDVTLSEAIKNMAQTKLLSEFNYLSKNAGNVSMLSSIATFYAADIGIKKQVYIEEIDGDVESGPLAFYDIKSGTYNLVVNKNTGGVNPAINNFANLSMSLTHEKVHEDDLETRFPLRHVDAIIKETTSKYFEKSSLEFRQAAAGYAAQLLNEAISNGVAPSAIEKKVEEFNNSKFGETSILNYFKEEKRVNSINLLESVEINGIKYEK